MKKLIYLFVALGICSMASAQKITEKDLQGNWKLIGLSTNGVYLDVTSGTVTIPDDLKTQLTPDITTQINDAMTQAAAQLKNSTASFTGNNLKQNMGGKEKNGTFSLKDVEGGQLMTTTWSDATTSETGISIKDKKLSVLRSGQGQTAEFIFTKA